MSTSLKVVSDAAVFCDCFRRSAIRRRIRFIFTRRSSRLPKTGPVLAELSFVCCCFGGDSFLGSGGGWGFDGWGVGSGFDSDFGGSGVFSPSAGAGFASVEAASSFGGSLDSLGASDFSPPSGAAPASILAISWSTVTVSSSLARSSFSTPASGALTATSIYSPTLASDAV